MILSTRLPGSISRRRRATFERFACALQPGLEQSVWPGRRRTCWRYVSHSPVCAVLCHPRGLPWLRIVPAASLPSARHLVIHPRQRRDTSWTHNRVAEVTLGTQGAHVRLPKAGQNCRCGWWRSRTVVEFQNNILAAVERDNIRVGGDAIGGEHDSGACRQLVARERAQAGHEFTAARS
jgi:hypothetical protein